MTTKKEVTATTDPTEFYKGEEIETLRSNDPNMHKKFRLMLKMIAEGNTLSTTAQYFGYSRQYFYIMKSETTPLAKHRCECVERAQSIYIKKVEDQVSKKVKGNSLTFNQLLKVLERLQPDEWGPPKSDDDGAQGQVLIDAENIIVQATNDLFERKTQVEKE